MSGTSLDGVDIACVESNRTKNGNLILVYATQFLMTKMENQLSNLYKQSDKKIKQIDIKYGQYLGDLALKFIQTNNLQILSAHMGTIFHKPESNYTLQIGDGQSIANQYKKLSFAIFDLDISLADKELPWFQLAINYFLKILITASI